MILIMLLNGFIIYFCLKLKAMKKYALITLLTFLFAVQMYSQKSNEFRIYYGLTNNEFLINENILGGGSTENEKIFDIGIKYLTKISNKLYLETGINYLSTSVKITNSSSNPQPQSRFEDFKLFSIPVYANYTFKKHFFINGGPIIDFQGERETIDSQSGIGYSIGFGWKYYIYNYSIFINPNYKRHAVIPFEKERFQLRLTEIGIQIGAGYTF